MIQDPNLAALEFQDALSFEVLENTAHHLPDTAEFIRKYLVRRLHGNPLCEQQGGEPLIHLPEGNLFDERHQPGQSVAEKPKGKLPKGRTTCHESGEETLFDRHALQRGLGQAPGRYAELPRRQLTVRTQASPACTL